MSRLIAITCLCGLLLGCAGEVIERGMGTLLVSQAFAQPVRVRDVCWGDSWAVCDVLNLRRPFEHFPCGSGGHSGFNRTVVCNRMWNCRLGAVQN